MENPVALGRTDNEVNCTDLIGAEVRCDEVMGDARGVRAVAEDQKLKLHRVVGR